MDGTIVLIDPIKVEREKVKNVLNSIAEFNIIEISELGEDTFIEHSFSSPSLIILDIHPSSEKKCLDLLAVIRKNTGMANVPVIITSVADKPELKKSALKYRVKDFIAKPYEIKRLENSIRSIIKIEKKFTYDISGIKDFSITFEDYIVKVLDLSDRIKQPLSIILIALQDHKQAVVQKMNNIDIKSKVYSTIHHNVTRLLRKTDTAVINENNEILVILPATPSSSAKAVDEKIRTGISNEIKTLDISFTDYFYSVWVTYPLDGKDFNTLMRNAYEKVENKRILDRISSIADDTKKYASRRYNQFRGWFL